MSIDHLIAAARETTNIPATDPNDPKVTGAPVPEPTEPAAGMTERERIARLINPGAFAIDHPLDPMLSIAQATALLTADAVLAAGYVRIPTEEVQWGLAYGDDEQADEYFESLEEAMAFVAERRDYYALHGRENPFEPVTFTPRVRHLSDWDEPLVGQWRERYPHLVATYDSLT